MGKNLVIVESPAKAKTIEKFLGKDFTVKSSFGHIRDLAKKNLGIDLENGYAPSYEISADKKKVVSELRKELKDSHTVWLASDEDREGEAIAWHLYEVLKLNESNTKRIVFHEITKGAILNAIENPRAIDKNLVDAQQARRVLDRIVGFELSPVLWKKVKPSLSAGRVQSVAVRIIVEREREIIAHVPVPSFKTSGIFGTADGKKFSAELLQPSVSEDAASAKLQQLSGAAFSIKNIEKKPAKRSPAAPFTTSTLQQEASRKLGFPVAKTMTVAQKLYEAGHITYMRTDSLNLSETAISAAKGVIEKQYGADYSSPRRFQSKQKGAQEAHEAIRPTNMGESSAGSSYDEKRLYELIWKRTLASQMADAKLEKTSIEVQNSANTDIFYAKGEVITFDGFLRVYSESTDDEPDENTEGLLPKLSSGDKVSPEIITSEERYSKHLPRYTEASLVRKLEELGIGRPSTYAPTISTVQKRNYVIKEDRAGTERELNLLHLKAGVIAKKTKKEIFGAEKAKLFPTDIGMVVNDFLVKHFQNILDYNFTAKVEKEFDEIAEGTLNWTQMLDQFYMPFHETVNDTLEHSERGSGERLLGSHPETGKPVTARIGRYGPMVQHGAEGDEKVEYASLSKGNLLETISLEEALSLLAHSKEGRLLGIDPASGKEIFARIGRFGPLAQLGNSDTEDKPQYASLKPGQSIDNVTLEQAIELFKLPRQVGMYEDKPVIAADGRFGPYLSHGGSFTSLKKTDDPLSVTIERAVELIVEKREKDIERTIKIFDEDPKIKVLFDRWKNPSVLYKKRFHRISKDEDPALLSLERCYQIAGASPTEQKAESKKTAKPKKTATAKKSPAAKKPAASKKPKV
jgi:DNA topoisomerase I